MPPRPPSRQRRNRIEAHRAAQPATHAVVIAAHMDGSLRSQRAQCIDHLVGPRAIPHHIAQVPELIEPPPDVALRYSKDRLKSVQISVDVRNYERTHKQPV
jgi:hypothetical protein